MQKYQDAIWKPNGSVVPGVSVLVQSYPGAVTATIYSDDGLTPVANPLTTDAYGRFSFYSSDGRYQLVVSGAGITTQTVTDILLEDPDDGSALKNFTDAVNSTAPNATVPVVSFTATNAATDVDLALVRKGAGALLARVPDNTNVGGNKRGSFAVDWQITCPNAPEVASGYFAAIGGGTGNTGSGAYSAISGGSFNAASGYGSQIAGGTNNSALSNWCTVGGGNGNTASGWGATVPGGFNASTLGIYGKYAYSSGMFSAVGDAQRGSLTLRAATINATPAVLTSDAGAAGTANQLILQNNQAMVVRGQVLVRQSVAGADKCAAWEFTCVIRRGANAAATALVAAAAVTSIANDAAFAVAIAVTADTTNGGLKVEGTGLAATNLRWLCTVTSTEVTYA